MIATPPAIKALLVTIELHSFLIWSSYLSREGAIRSPSWLLI